MENIPNQQSAGQQEKPKEEENHPKAPNIVQKAVHYLTYPAGLATAYFFTRKFSRENVEKFYADNDPEFAKIKQDLKEKYNIANGRDTEGKPLEKAVQKLSTAKEDYLLREETAKATTAFLEKKGFKHTYDYFKHNLKAGKEVAIINGFGAAAIVVGLGSFLSENKAQAKALKADEKSREQGR